jgi:hypothetical protein
VQRVPKHWSRAAARALLAAGLCNSAPAAADTGIEWEAPAACPDAGAVSRRLRALLDEDVALLGQGLRVRGVVDALVVPRAGPLRGPSAHARSSRGFPAARPGLGDPATHGGRGLTATLCPGTLFECATPLAPPYVVQDGVLGTVALPPGVAGIPVPEGFDGFIQLTVSGFAAGSDDSYVPVDYYLGGPISESISFGQPVVMFTRRNLQTAIEQSFAGADPSLVTEGGAVVLGVFDCNSQPVADARVEISLGGGAAEGMQSFLMPPSRIPVAPPAGEPLRTGASGVVGYLGVPPGTVQLRAYRPGEAQPFATSELGAVPGEFSVAALRPGYLSSADLNAGAPFSEPGL